MANSISRKIIRIKISDELVLQFGQITFAACIVVSIVATIGIPVIGFFTVPVFIGLLILTVMEKISIKEISDDSEE